MIEIVLFVKCITPHIDLSCTADNFIAFNHLMRLCHHTQSRDDRTFGVPIYLSTATIQTHSRFQCDCFPVLHAVNAHHVGTCLRVEYLHYYHLNVYFWHNDRFYMFLFKFLLQILWKKFMNLKKKKNSPTKRENKTFEMCQNALLEQI